MNKRLSLAFVILGMLLLLSCSRNVTNVRKGEDIVLYPLPPDTARVQFLTTISGSIDVTGKQSGFSKFVMGEAQAMPIIKPYGLAFHKDRLYVCDAGLACLEVMDLGKKTFEYFAPKGRGQLKNPVNCCTDTAGNLYVADPSRRQIVIFDKAGNYVDAIGEAGNTKPTDVAVTSDKIWVPDANHHQINVYQKDTKKLAFSFPDTLEKTDGYLYQPINICVTPDVVYVTDFGDFKVKSYTHTGEFISAIGGFGNGLGQFVRPKGIAADNKGNLFVADAAFENVQIFNKDGQLLMFFGGNKGGAGNMSLPAKVLVDYNNLAYFQKYVDPAFNLKYLIFVTNQYGNDKISVYGAVEAKK